jgi:hypothetical protein
MFRTRGSIFRKTVVRTPTYKVTEPDACKYIPYHNPTYKRLSEDEPSGSKHVEDIIN